MLLQLSSITWLLLLLLPTTKGSTSSCGRGSVCAAVVCVPRLLLLNHYWSRKQLTLTNHSSAVAPK
jgi:hypothetical protein